MEQETKKVWAVVTNTDLTEGRGREYIMCLCELYATAKRKATKAGVQGTDATVFSVDLVKQGSVWYGPVEIEKPTADDIEQERVFDRITKAEKKALELGLTYDDIAALRMK